MKVWRMFVRSADRLHCQIFGVRQAHPIESCRRSASRVHLREDSTGLFRSSPAPAWGACSGSNLGATFSVARTAEFSKTVRPDGSGTPAPPATSSVALPPGAGAWPAR